MTFGELAGEARVWMQESIVDGVILGNEMVDGAKQSRVSGEESLQV